jgi:hypothetical protein
LADHVFATPEVKKHLWRAITKRSAVYKLIRSAAEKTIYVAALSALEDASGRPDMCPAE